MLAKVKFILRHSV